VIFDRLRGQLLQSLKSDGATKSRDAIGLLNYHVVFGLRPLAAQGT